MFYINISVHVLYNVSQYIFSLYYIYVCIPWVPPTSVLIDLPEDGHNSWNMLQ